MLRSLATLLLISLISHAQTGPDTEAPTPLRLAGNIFVGNAGRGELAEIEVRDLPRASAEPALTLAWETMAAAATTTRRLEAISGGDASESRQLDEATARWLLRTNVFCAWSDGAMSALGAGVHRLWGAGRPVAEMPTASRLEPAVAAAKCDQLAIDPATWRLALAPDVALDLRHFSRGWAVDRAVEALRASGARNFWVRVGPVARAGGDGPAGRGWRYELPLFPGLTEPLSALRLIDQAVAVADPSVAPIEIAGERFAPFIDLRSGRPASGVSGVVVVSELAADAQPMAAALFVFGANAGQMRLGVLRPKPAVLWLLGSPQAGAPVLATAHWSAVKKW